MAVARRLPGVARGDHGVLQCGFGGEIESDRRVVSTVARLEKHRGAELRSRGRGPDANPVAIEVDHAQQTSEILPAHALREADAFHSRVALGELQSRHETPEVGAVDLVVAGQQHGANADDLEVGVEPGLQLAMELLRVGDEFGAGLDLNGGGSRRRHIPTRRRGQRTREREQPIGY